MKRFKDFVPTLIGSSIGFLICVGLYKATEGDKVQMVISSILTIIALLFIREALKKKIADDNWG
jgi:hypothetical protein